MRSLSARRPIKLDSEVEAEIRDRLKTPKTEWVRYENSKEMKKHLQSSPAD